MPFLGRTITTNLADFHTDNYAAGSGFTAGSTTTLALTISGIDDENALRISFDGVNQHHDTWSLSSSTVTFDTAIPTGVANVEIQYGKQPTSSAFEANSVDGSHIALGSDAQGDVLYYNGTNYARLAAGTDGEFLKTQGSSANPTWATPTAGFTLTAEAATTSGSGVTISGISGAKLIYVIMNDVGTNGTGDWHMQIGDSGGLETAGYHSYLSKITTSTSSESIANGSEWIIGENTHTAHHIEGHVVLTLQDETNNDWVMHTVAATDDERFVAAGHKSLSAALTQIQIRTDDTFDQGVFSVLYM